MISTADVIAVGLIETSSRGLIQSWNTAEQHSRTTELHHAELAVHRALEKVQCGIQYRTCDRYRRGICS